MADRAQGYKYQLNVTAYLASLLSKDETVKDYQIFYEVSELEPFDDIVLAVDYKGSQNCLYLVQVKSGKVKLDVNNYLSEYNKITKNKLWNCLKSIDNVSERNFQFWYFACQTFRPQFLLLRDGSETKELEIKKLKRNSYRSIVTRSMYELLSKDDDIRRKYEDFFNEFYIFLEQPGTSKIGNLLKGMWGLNDAAQIIEYLDKYFTKNKTESLSKKDFEHELLRIRLWDSIVKPIKVVKLEKESALAWNDLTLSYDVTIVKNEPDIEACLFGCVACNVGEKISIEQWNSFVDKEGKLSKEVKEEFAVKSLKPETLKDLLFSLWTCGRIPLIVKGGSALLLLQEFKHWKRHYVVMDSDPDKIYDEMQRYDLSAVKNLAETSADTLLKSVLVSMQGREPSSLYKIIDGDTSLKESLTCSDILKLMEPRQLYVSNDCFEGNMYMLFIIETTNPKPISYENIEPNGDNISVYCHPSQCREVHERIRQDPELKLYKIFHLRLQNDKLILRNKISESDRRRNLLGLTNYLVDQYGNSAYSTDGDKAVPIIGKVLKMTCLNYLERYIRIGAVTKDKYGSMESANSNINLTETVFPEKDFLKEMTAKICVVAGEAGIGKTTFLQSLIRTCDTKRYVLFCNLVRFQVCMREDSQKLFKDPLKFLWSTQGRFAYDNFLNLLGKDQKRLILILDSFDEVISTCKEQVLELVRKLNKESCVEKIIIGSRLLTVNLLSTQFDIKIAKIEEFSNEYNWHYLQNWGFDENILQELPEEFATNPLYLDMLRTIYQASDINLRNLSRWALYERIVDLQIQHYCQRTGHVLDDFEIESMLTFYRKLAVKFIFGTNQVTEKFALLNEHAKFSNHVRLGMIKYFNENEEPVFLHRTFAEFLAAQWLIKTADKEDAKFIYKMILNDDQFSVLDIHSQQFPLHKAVLCRDNSEEIIKLCRENEEVLILKDGIGRTALHLAAIRYSRHDVKSLATIIHHMRKGGYDLYSRDHLLNWTWVDYCENNSWFRITKIVPPLCAIQKAYWSFYASNSRSLNASRLWKIIDFDELYRMLLNHPLLFNTINDVLSVRYCNKENFMRICNFCLNSKVSSVKLPKYSKYTRLHLTPLHVASLFSNTNVVSACLKRGDNVNVVDAFGCTPLFYSVGKQEVEIAKLLMEKGADLALQPDAKWGLSTFQLSLRTKNKNITKMLIEKVNVSKFGSIWLYDAIRFGDIDVVEMLLTANVDPNLNVRVNESRHFETEIFDRDVLKEFKQCHDYAYDFTTMSIDELMLFMEILQNIKYGRLNRYNLKILTLPLNVAIHAKRKDIVEVLLKNGADANLQICSDESYYNNLETLKNYYDCTPFCCAIRHKNIDIINLLLRNGANVNYVDKHGLTPIKVAINERLTDFITNHQYLLLVERAISPLNYYYNCTMLYNMVVGLKNINESSWSLIKSAISERSLQIAEILLHAAGSSDLTLLDQAIAKRNWEIVEVLLRHANPSCLRQFNITRLLAIIPRENIKIIELLLKKGADPNYKTAGDVTPLYVAARRRDPDMLKLLLDNGANPKIITCTTTLLANAKQKGQSEGIIWMWDLNALCFCGPIHDPSFPFEVLNLIQAVENQENINLVIASNTDFIIKRIKDAVDFTNPNAEEYIDAVLQLNNKEVDQILLRNFRKYHEKKIQCYTAVGYVAKHRNKAMIEILSRNEEGVNSMSETGRTTLVSVIKRQVMDKSVVEFLIENHADVNLADKTGNTPLITAIRRQNIGIVEILLKNNAFINAVGMDDISPLIAAVQEANPVITRILLENGADVNYVCKNGVTPLYVSVLGGNEEIIKMLLDSNANPNIEVRGNTLLYNAIRLGHCKIIYLLLQQQTNLSDQLNIPGHQGIIDRIYRNRANANAIYEFGSSPLHLAAKTGNYISVAILLKWGADPNQVDNQGRTPLHYAVEINKEDMVKRLLSKYASVNIKDKNNLTPLDCAVINKNHDIIEMLGGKNTLDTSCTCL